MVTDYLRDVNFLYVAEKAKDANISVENKKLLDTLIETGKKDVDGKRNLIEKEMGTAASSLIDSINESVFRTPEVFFSVILDLWKNLNLI